MGEYERITQIASSLTCDQYEKYVEHFMFLLGECNPKETTILKRYVKIPDPNDPGNFLYEVEYSDFVKKFLDYMAVEFQGRDQEILQATNSRVFAEVFKITGW